MEASLAVQRALVAALSADPALEAASVPVFDTPPPDALPPYVSVGTDRMTVRAWQGGRSEEHRLLVSAWLDGAGGGGGHGAAKALIAQIEAALARLPNRLGPYRLVRFAMLDAQVRPSRRGWIEARAQFGALTVKEDG